MNYKQLAIEYAARADALKPYHETPERAAIEAQLALAYATIALVERLDKLTTTENVKGVESLKITELRRT